MLHAPMLHAPMFSQATPLISANVSLAPQTTFRVGGLAEWYAAPKTLAELIECVDWARSQSLPITTLGAGSNLLISDQGIPGLVLSSKYLRQAIYDVESGLLTVSAGAHLPTVAWEAARRGWEGLEWAAGIPGTVGGGVVMNAGAQGGCIAERLVNTTVLGPNGLEVWTPEQLNYSYRTSSLQHSPYIVTQATLQLAPGADPKHVHSRTSDNLQQRKATQPYNMPNCGSVFRNPQDHAAAWLIEQTGLKGYQIGNAQVAHRHANFILNCGGATAQDIFHLIHHVRSQVWDQWSLALEPEVKMLGNFSAV